MLDTHAQDDTQVIALNVCSCAYAASGPARIPFESGSPETVPASNSEPASASADATHVSIISLATQGWSPGLMWPALRMTTCTWQRALGNRVPAKKSYALSL